MGGGGEGCYLLTYFGGWNIFKEGWVIFVGGWEIFWGIKKFSGGGGWEIFGGGVVLKNFRGGGGGW